jgi:hypothetical protein
MNGTGSGGGGGGLGGDGLSMEEQQQRMMMKTVFVPVLVAFVPESLFFLLFTI